MPTPNELWSHVRKAGEPHPYDRLAGTDWKTGAILEELRKQAAQIAALTKAVEQLRAP